MINYYLITKPGIVMGNLVTLAGGFLLASKGDFNFILFLDVLVGLAFIMASACVFNNLIDKQTDQKMNRTKERPLATGKISTFNAVSFAVLMVITGNLILYYYTNPLALLVADSGFFVYVVLYSMWKCHTVYGTAIGSIAGAVPPVVGYCAAAGTLDTGALILFIMLVLWQMPHFFAIATYHLEDYTRAGIPVLPVVKGLYQTKVHAAIYIAAFIVTALLLTYFQYTGHLYAIVTVAFGLAWLALSLNGFRSHNNRLWGKQMFRFSLVTIMAIFLAIPF